MTTYLKQSTASQEVLLGPFVDATDGNTAETGLTIANTDIKVWKAGATTLANKNSGGATHISGGNYYAVLDATDTDTLGSGTLIVQVAGALAVRHDFCVLAANVYDSLIGGGDLLDVSTTQFNGSAVVQSGGRPEVNTTHVGGTSQTGGDIIGDTNDIQARLPAALVSGRIDASVGAMAANVITATAINADAITDAKVASDVTIASVTGAVGSVTGNVGGNVVGSVASVTARVTANTDQLAGQTVTAAAGVTFPASVASPTNITAGTITTVTNLTNAPTNGDLTTAMKASVNAEADTAISDAALATAANLATVAGYLDTEIAEILAVTNKLDDTLEDDGGTFRFTANALEEAPTGGSAPTAVEIADEVETRAMTLTAGERTATADALLNRDMSAVSDTNSRSPLNALRFVRNKWTTAAGSLSVKKEDDTTEAWSATLTTDAGAEPLTGIDPA